MALTEKTRAEEIESSTGKGKKPIQESADGLPMNPGQHFEIDPAVKPLFWLLNSYTLSQNAAVRINRWAQDISNSKVKLGKGRTSPQPSSSNQWKDLLDAIAFADKRQNSAEGQAASVLSCLSACFLLPKIVHLPRGGLSLEEMEPIVAEASQKRIDHFEPFIQPWAEQILAVEMPLWLVTQFPDLIVSDDWCEPAIEWMSEAIQEGLDQNGWPSAKLLPLFGPMMASWMRSYFMLNKLGWEFDERVLEQLRSAVRQLLRLLRPDRRLMFTDSNSVPLSQACLKKLLKLSNHRLDREIAEPLLKQASKFKRGSIRRKTKPGYLSEQCESVILRANWQSSSGRVGLMFAGSSNHCEIGSHTTLVQGAVFPKIEFDSRELLPRSGFHVACEEQDKDVEYLELEMELTDGGKFTRQWLLAREEAILIVADTLALPSPGKIEYRCRWPLAEQIRALPESETQEIYLTQNEIQSLVLPLSLSEWKVGVAAGKLESLSHSHSLGHSHSLELSARQQGSALYVPLVFDLNPQRSRQKRTWRTLTVAESRNAVSNSVAAAFRFQIGKEQWYLYRALTSKAPRTFLGEHFSGEFVFGRFKKSGQKKELLRIE
jgi:hypothetical protein